MLQTTQASTTTAPDYILRFYEVKARTGLCSTDVYRLAAAGRFPRPVKLGKRASGWSNNAVQAWIDAKLAGGEA